LSAHDTGSEIDHASEVRVFVGTAAVDVPAGSTALEAVGRSDPALARDVTAGARLITDSRGLPLPSDTIVRWGTILRVVAARSRSDDAATPSDE
jgi:hypothetical protein